MIRDKRLRKIWGEMKAFKCSCNSCLEDNPYVDMQRYVFMETTPHELEFGVVEENADGKRMFYGLGYIQVDKGSLMFIRHTGIRMIKFPVPVLDTPDEIATFIHTRLRMEET